MATSTLWTLTSWFVEKWNILNYCYGFYNIADLFYQKSHQIQFNLLQSNIQTKMKKEKDNVLNCYKWAITLQKFAGCLAFVQPTCLTPTTTVISKWYLLSLQVTSRWVEFMTIMTLALTSQVHVCSFQLCTLLKTWEAIRWVSICHFQSFFPLKAKNLTFGSYSLYT